MTAYCTRCGGADDLLVKCRDFLTEHAYLQTATTKDSNHMHSVETTHQYICLTCLWKEMSKTLLGLGG